MEINLIRERMVYSKRILGETRRAEESGDMIVPDALPDILQIISADADLTVRAKDLSGGRAVVSGSAAVTVIYVPDDAVGLRRVSLDLPFSVAVENEEISVNSPLVTRLALDRVSASAINPRKLSASVAIRAEIAVYNKVDVSLPTDVIAYDDAELELLTSTTELILETDVLEKMFVVADEYLLPSAGEILRTSVTLTGDETKVVGSKLIIKGAAQVSVLFSAGEGGTELSTSTFVTEFSQIIELESADGDSDFELIPLLAGSSIALDPLCGVDGRRLVAELHIVAQAVARKRCKLNFLSDAYALRYALSAEHEPLELVHSPGTRLASSVLRGTLAAPDFAHVISISAHAGAAEAAVEGTNMQIRYHLHVEALYAATDDTVRSASGDFPLETSLADTDAGSIFNIRVCEIAAADIVADGDSRGIEFRTAVDIRAEELQIAAYSPISAITIDEDTPVSTAALPSLVISRVTASSATLWELAKRHHSTRELILQANGFDDETVAKGAEVLIIPKKR